MIGLVFTTALYAAPLSEAPSSLTGATLLTPSQLQELKELAPLLRNLEILEHYEVIRELELYEDFDDPEELEEP